MFFLKVNIESMLYALMIAIPIQLMLNVCRISRLTEWTIDTVNIVSSVIIISGFILCSVFLINLTKRWLSETKAWYCNVILWLPYVVLFLYMTTSLFPITYQGDVPNTASGLMAIGALAVFPFYILLISLVKKNEQGWYV
ncbi:hypothetical protein NX029_15575 [Cytobacillus firmus]|nr:hypothetical protein [Cytobacillus firmus]